MKFTYAALAAVAAAEQMYGYVGEANGDFPAVTTPLTFVQSAGQENFQILMDQTSGNPDPPALNTDCVFDLAGTSTHPIEIAQLEFVCFLSELRSMMRSSTSPPQQPTQAPFGPHQ